MIPSTGSVVTRESSSARMVAAVAATSLRLSFAVAIITEERIFFPSRVLNHAIHNFTPNGKHQCAQGQPAKLHRIRMDDLFHGIPQQFKAHQGDHDGDHQRGQIFHAPMSERMSLVRRLCRQLIPKHGNQTTGTVRQVVERIRYNGDGWESEPITYFSRNNTTLQQIPTTLLNVP